MNHWISKTKRIRIMNGDCLAVLDKLPDNCVDTVICDPPYDLTAKKKGGTGIKSLNLKHPAGRSRITTGGFMGLSWDATGIAFKKSTWRKVLRVLKPGGYLLAFGGTRTYHRMAVAIEDAGFEIRDCIQWLYGSGFPKSMNISKEIDRVSGHTRKIIAPPPYKRGKATQQYNEHRKVSYDYSPLPLTAPVSLEATVTEGYGTALKPAYEPIVLAMKALDGTYANNALTHGVAGLNIGDCRIATEDNLNGGGYSKGASKGMWTPGAGGGGLKRLPGQFKQPEGRWPANVILDEEAGKLLDQQTGILTSGKLDRSRIRAKNKTYGNAPKQRTGVYRQDSGGASRFFYCAKASRKDRGEGNRHPTVKPTSLMEYLCKLTRTPTGGIVLDPFMGSGTTGIACIRTGRKFVGIEINEDYFKIAKKRIIREINGK